MTLIGWDGFPENAKRDNDVYLEEDDPAEFAIRGVNIYMARSILTAWGFRLKLRRGELLSQSEIILWDILVEQYKRSINRAIEGYELLPRDVRFEAQVKYDTLRALIFDEKI